MVREVALALTPQPEILVLAVLADLWLGDPVYRWHPVRIIGWGLARMEDGLRAIRADGYGGGVILFFGLAVAGMGGAALLLFLAASLHHWVGVAAHVFLTYSLLALGDLFRHVWRIESAVRAGNLERARVAVRALVGRDTDRMDGPACRRAAVESLSENLTDGFVSPVCWYAIGGPLGLVLFKVVSTMDSMVGYKTDRYRRFGWCGARLDDFMNYVPARLTWLMISVVAAAIPGLSGPKAWRVGLVQHGALPGPNSGWSEAAAAGALGRRLVGPIWLNGVQVTDRWIGDSGDPPLATAEDVSRALVLTLATAGVVAALVATALAVTARVVAALA
jgi:adenosylcobinamide-phosphate synthase